MNLSFFTSFFKKNNNKTLELPQSILIKELISVANNNNLNIFQNITIYHHTQNFVIPLLIVDEKRGIFLFEYKDWSYHDLKNAKIEKATKQEASKDTLAFQRTHEFIKQKFNELTHNDGVPIFNYLLMENFNKEQYKHLNNSFKELLPEEKIMFNNSSPTEILNKMMKSDISKNKLPNLANIMGTLLIQYAIISKDKTMHLASKEQMKFIDSPLQKCYILKSLYGAGSTNTVLLKAILEKLKNPKLNIVIVKPTTLACDILKKKLLEIVEYAIVELDITTIEIITPKDIVQKSFKMIDLLICDDSQLYSNNFISKISKYKTSLILVERYLKNEGKLSFTKKYKSQNEQSILYQENPYAKTLQLIATLLINNSAKDIVVVSSNQSRENLKTDLEFFIEEKVISLDSSKNLIDQDLNSLILSSYEDINSLDVKFAILIDISSVDIYKLQYASNLAKEKVYILYQDECENLNILKDNFENYKK